MPLLSFALRHLRRHGRLNIAALLGLTLAAALVASLPSYAVAIAARELDQNLDEAHSTERNLLISGSRYTFNDELYDRLQESLGPLFKERLVVRQVTLATDPLPPSEQSDRRTISFLAVYSFDKLSDMVRLVEGRLPTQVSVREAEPHRPAPVEAVIGARAAELSGYGIGDRLTANKAFQRVDIVGIVEPLDPHDDIWGEDSRAFDVAIDTSDPNVDTVALPLIIASSSMRSNFKFIPIFQHTVVWRIILKHELMTVDNAQAFRSDLINLQTQFGTKGAKISTGLVHILADYLARLSRVRTTLFLLTAQAFIFVLYTLTMLTSFILDRSQLELATLSGRGASAWQITRVFALQNLILALPAALLLGPGLAQVAMRLWATSTGEIVPAALPRDSWLLSGLASSTAWLALVLPVYPAARRSVLDWQKMRARPSQRSVTQKLYLDLFLLISGGLLYWQLDQSGSFVTRRLGNTQLADPLLLMAPSLLLVAVALVSLRLFPFLLRLVAWIFQRLRGLMLPLGLHRLARNPLRPSRVVLLISLTSGLILFTNAFDDSLSHAQEETAHYLAGADLRISLDQPTDLPASQLTDQPGILTAATIFRGTVRTEEGQAIQLFAVDPATFAQVARYPAGLTNFEISTVMNVIQPDSKQLGTTTDALPAVFSFSALPTAKNVGDQLFLNLAGQQHPFSVQGTINSFPTLSGPFVIVSLPDLVARVHLDGLGARMSGTHEAWLAVDPGQHQDLIGQPAFGQRVLDDAQAQLRALRSDVLAQGTSGALQLNTLTLALLSVAAFTLVHYFEAQRRTREFGILRATGLSVQQLLSLLVTEAVLVMALGLVTGTAIGYGMARVMIPYLSQALSESLAGVTINRILVNWSAIAQQYLILIALFGGALLLLLLLLLRTGVHQTMRVGDE